MLQIVHLDMLLPFDDSYDQLSEEEQLLSLKGCVLCRITRDVDAGSTRAKPEWKACREEIGVPIRVHRIADAPPASRVAAKDLAPSIVAVDAQGQAYELLDRDSIAKCNGRVADLRGRLKYRAASLGLSL